MRFGNGPPNCGRAATIEHLEPRSRGGSGALANLRLCHVGCNRHLADHSPEQKRRMRINVPTASGRALPADATKPPPATSR
ncbi:MAG: HNH endonuclease [Parasphingopyxis sp.]|uniref:HNH endonuclease n=1 Tax=Parasphingopyxis sp. TaxID=1920299 RepID=UPI003FA17F4C